MSTTRIQPSSSHSRAGRRRKNRPPATTTAGMLLRKPTVLIGGGVVLLWVAIALMWPVLTPFDPSQTNPMGVLTAPSVDHWLGTDNLGRDVFSRVLAGSTSVLIVAPLATLVGLVFGGIIGATAGYFRGWWDATVMRLLESILIVPVIIIAITVLALFGTSRLNVILTIGILFTPHIARTIRSAVLVERQQDYVSASWLQGSSSGYTICMEILRNITGPIIVEATVRLGYAIFVAAGLAFLSLGVQEPSPDWGLTISLGRPYVQSAPWIVLAPAAALTTLVVAVNLLADGVKEVLDQ